MNMVTTASINFLINMTFQDSALSSMKFSLGGHSQRWYAAVTLLVVRPGRYPEVHAGGRQGVLGVRLRCAQLGEAAVVAWVRQALLISGTHGNTRSQRGLSWAKVGPENRHALVAHTCPCRGPGQRERRRRERLRARRAAGGGL